MRVHVGRKQAQTLGQIGSDCTKFILTKSRIQVQKNVCRRSKHNVSSTDSGILAGKAVLPHRCEIVEAGLGKGNLPA